MIEESKHGKPSSGVKMLVAMGVVAAYAAFCAADAAPQRVCGGDPFIHLENGMYYLYFSSGDTVGLTVYTSTDLKEWLPDQGRDKFGRAYVNGNGFGSNRFWAPEMHKYKGKYYLFHSAEEKVTVDVGDSPLGPFRNPEKKPFFPEGNIDNSFFLDDDGTPYMLYAHFYAGNEVWICELEKDLLHAKPETQRKLIRAEEDWEMNRKDPRFSKWSIAEGPCLVKKDGLYWLTYSSHHVIDDNYNVCLATATNVKGPYVKQGKGPILAPRGNYKCTGHHSLFKDKSGNWKIVFHSRDPNGGPRYTYTADAKFTTKDGHPWIDIGEFQPCVIKKDARPASLPQPQNVPALMKTSGGKDVKSLADWEKTRAPELRELFEREEYGRRPAAADERGRVSFETYRESEAFGGKAICKHVRVTYDGPNGKHSFPITAYIPKTGKPTPAFVYIAIDFYTKYDADGAVTTSEYWPVEQLIDRGYATAAFSVIRVAADKSNAGFSQGVFKAVQPESERGPDSWATISAWAWGASRVMDWMETEPLIDAKHVGAVGHSRGGKTALWTGVTDKRFAMACSNESGCGGAKLNHIPLPRSESIDVISGPTRFHYWFCRNFRKYAGKEMSMDFDQHQMIALIAPRLVCIGSATEDHWCGQLGEWWAAKLASPAWELYGKKGLVADKWPDPETPQQAGCVSYHLRTGKHFLTPYDWGRYMDFADRHGWRATAVARQSATAVARQSAMAAAKPGPIFAKYRFDSKSNLYPVGGTAKVEAYVADKHGNLATKGVVDIWVDDGWTNVVWRRTVDLAKEPRIKMEFTRATPGSLRIYMKGKNIPVRERMDRMIFGMGHIEPFTPCPPDFESYWRGELARLEREVPIAVEKAPAPKLDTPDHTAYYVSFATFNGGRIYGLLLVPKGEGRFPAMVNVPGAGPGTTTIFPSKRQLVRKGWITLLMNVHGIPLTGTNAEYHARYKKWFAEYATKAGEPRYQYVGYAESREAPFYHRTILGMTRAIDWLAKEPYADSSRFVYYGCSQGGGFGLYLTAMWGRFAKSLVLCPNKCDMLAYRAGRQPGSSHIMNQKPENIAAAEKNAPYHDNCNFARMIRTPVRMVYGTADDNCQTIGGIAAFNCIASKDKQLRLLSGQGHGWHTAGFENWLFDLTAPKGKAK